MYMRSMGKSFKDSLKVLEADIQHANTLASDFSREYDGASLQMRMSYSPAAHLFLFLVQWTDCHLAGALGLLRILIYKVESSFRFMLMAPQLCVPMREKQAYENSMVGFRVMQLVRAAFFNIGHLLIASFLMSKFCGPAVIYPSLVQLQGGVTETEDKRQKAVCMERYRRRDEEEHKQYSDIEIERREECGICMEMNSKIVLPNCNHIMCLKCYRDWFKLSYNLLVLFDGNEPRRTRSQSCPFCRDCLKGVDSADLWVFMDSRDVIDMATLTRENLRRLFMYIDKLPLVVPVTIYDPYDSHLR
ncbi:hypothetical protein RHMOL_Rhmol02G0139200 [Rhododendron molle]|uniref:Uncharacterized protein n=1 Tax=Rhododendron molle TaxID=49168 RepID=A0ACC0PR71_RHOML|nr:hypothetical protein RHMOL_Rhmol02G0139200 [Rhododendron molle]